MAVGVIIGAAFGTIVTSLVNDIIMPIITMITGGIDFSNWFYRPDGKSYATLAEAQAAGAATLNYGTFISKVINFLIVAFCIFLVVRAFNRMDERMILKAPVAPKTKICPFCKSEIPIDAVRCPHCTSSLPSDGAAGKTPGSPGRNKEQPEEKSRLFEENKRAAGGLRGRSKGQPAILKKK